MSTNCRIGKLLDDGTVKSIYCHFDGGQLTREYLEAYYEDSKDVDDLLALGDISYLGKTPVSKEELWNSNFEDMERNFSRAYKDRVGDRSYGTVKPEISKDISEYRRFYSYYPYLYLYRDNRWEIVR